MNKKVLAIILQLPLLIVMIASFFASIFAAFKKIGGVNYAVSVILGIIIVLYFYGRYLGKKARKSF